MKLNVVAIPKGLLLLKLYDNALYQAPKFDLDPAIRQKVAGKNGILLEATALIKQNQSKFIEIDLGAGPRELHVNLSSFEVDFTQYDELHGVGTAQKVIREIREAIVAGSVEHTDDLIISVNKQLLAELNKPSNPTSKNTTSPSSIPSKESDLLLNLLSCQRLLEPYIADPIINSDETSQAFLKNLKLTLETKEIPKKYKDGDLQEFCIAWLELINPNNDVQKKQAICYGLYEKHTDKHAFACILSHMPAVIQIDLLRYSNNQAIYSFHKHMKYNTFYPGAIGYFASLVKIMTHSRCYSEQDKKHFLKHLLSFFQELKGLNPVLFIMGRVNSAEEALSCWMVTDSLPNDDNSLKFNSLLSEEHKPIFEELELKLQNLLRSISGADSASSIPFDFRNYADRLLLKVCFKRLGPNNYDCLAPIIGRIHEKEELEALYQIILNCKLQPNTLLVNYTILIPQLQYNPSNFPGLFIRGMMTFLKSKLTPGEFIAFINKLVRSVTPMFYSHERWAFRSIEEELLKYWSEQDPQQLINAVKISIHRKSSSDETPIMSFVQGVSPLYFNDRVLDGLLAQLDTLEFISFFSVCSYEVQHKIIEKLFKVCDPVKAIEQIKAYHRVYSDSVFPTRFKVAFTRHLKAVNESLFNQVKLEQCFGLKEQSDFERDLDNLKTILTNKQLTHDQQRSEIHQLKALNEALENDDTCSVVIDLFKAISRDQWPYLFTYFNAQIIDWSFPHDKKFLELLKSTEQELPKERANTWLNHLDRWKDILLSTLISLSNMKLDFSEEAYVPSWSLGYVQEALATSAKYIPEFPNTILREFFLTDVVKSMSVFRKITARSGDKYDFKQKYIINDELIASWLPEDVEQRVTLLCSAFTPATLTGSTQDTIEKFLKKPYVRNTSEQRQLSLKIVNEGQMHVLNLLESFSWESRKIMIQNLYQIDPLGTESLLLIAMNSILEQIPQDNPNYFRLINLLLMTLDYTDINVFNFINKIVGREKLIMALSNLDFWNIRSSWDIAPLLRMNAQLAPEYFYSKVTRYFESQSQKYFSLSTFTDLFGPAQKIAISPYSSYTNYLDSHPEEKNKYVQLLLSNLPEFKCNSSFKDMKLASLLIPDLDDHILKGLASYILSGALADQDKNSQKRVKECLDDLVQIYGVQTIVNKCRAANLETQARYLESKFKFYPQLLSQVRVLCKWNKANSDPEWQKIHQVNEKTLEVLSEFAGRGELSDSLLINYTSDILKQICQKAEVSRLELLATLPNAASSVEVHKTGTVLINGIFARDKHGNHLSKAGMKFAKNYLSEDHTVVLDKIEKEFHALDRKSQMLLQDEFTRLKASINDKKSDAHQVLSRL